MKSARDESARPVTRTAYPTDLTDAQWRRIEPLILRARPGGRPREVDLRAVINAILHVRDAACGWRRLPQGFPPWGTVHYYYRRWRRDGIWQQIAQALGLPGAPGE